MSQNGSIKIHLVNNTITRLDTEALVRICRTLNCSIADLLEDILPDKNRKHDPKPLQPITIIAKKTVFRIPKCTVCNQYIILTTTHKMEIIYLNF
ncbi:MAG: helix-turn-helix transcriptional regulator [Lachnospiraceae bacterium]|nr:helix-turn-helix transcriptional regulator [Lachnospiraceae bacterium]